MRGSTTEVLRAEFTIEPAITFPKLTRKKSTSRPGFTLGKVRFGQVRKFCLRSPTPLEHGGNFA